MTVVALHAGDGYTYLTRDIASGDHHRSRGESLTGYYTDEGNPPGRWVGSGLAALSDFTVPGVDAGASAVVAGEVSEAQMKALFGEGLHPNADQLIDAGAEIADVRLGRRFPLYSNDNPLLKDFAAAVKGFERDTGRLPDTAERDRMWMSFAREHYDRAHPDKINPSAQSVRAWAAREKNKTRQPVAGYDLTFTPVKSISVLWSLADTGTRSVVEQCHREAADEALRHLETNGLVTRRGGKGEAQIDTAGLSGGAFTHYDNRDGEPNLHTHYAVSNKVLGADGKWSSIDGIPFFKACSVASTRYDALLADKLTERLGVEFRARSKGADKQPVLELVGIDDSRVATHSGRTASIEQRYSELETQYIAQHHRAPSRAARYGLRKQATLETRQAKSALKDASGATGKAVHGLTATLRRARDTDTAAHPTAPRGAALLEHCRAAAEKMRARHTDTVKLTCDQLAGLVTEELERRFNTWKRTDIDRWATIIVEQQATAGTLPTGTSRTQLAENVADTVATESIRVGVPHPLLDTSTGLIPEQLTRASGEHVLTPVGGERFTSARVIDAEHALITATGTITAATTSPRAVKAAIAAVGEETGFALNPGQARLVEHFCNAGTLLAVGVGPAGTGKTTSMKATIAAWNNTDGLPPMFKNRKVIALAPSAAAAMKLGEELGLGTNTTDSDGSSTTGHNKGGKTPETARTIDKEVLFFAKNMQALAAARAAGDTAKVKQLRERMVRRIPRGSMLLVDEAGMASTSNLHEILRIAKATGSVVRLLGDPAQLDAVDRGGALDMLAHHTDAPALTEVVRFVQADRDNDGTLAPATETVTENGTEKTVKKGLDTVAAENSLRLRDGDHDSLEMFEDRGWLHHHTSKDDTLTRIVAEHLADQQRGSNAMIIATTREDVTTLNTMLQEHHRAAGTAHIDRTVNLSDGLTAGRGDVIVTRENQDIKRQGGRRHLLPIANGELWTVEKINRDGTVLARNLDDKGRIELPADYLKGQTELGYALTIHRSQGATVDVVRAVVDPRYANRPGLYVALTRGKYENRAYTFDTNTSHTPTGTSAADGAAGQTPVLEAHQQAGAGSQAGSGQSSSPTLTSSREILAAVLDNTSAHTAALTDIRTELRKAVDPDTALAVYNHAREHLLADYTTSLLADHLPTDTATALAAEPAGTARIRSVIDTLLTDGHTAADIDARFAGIREHLADARNPAALIAYKINPPAHAIAAAQHQQARQAYIRDYTDHLLAQHLPAAVAATIAADTHGTEVIRAQVGRLIAAGATDIDARIATAADTLDSLPPGHTSYARHITTSLRTPTTAAATDSPAAIARTLIADPAAQSQLAHNLAALQPAPPAPAPKPRPVLAPLPPVSPATATLHRYARAAAALHTQQTAAAKQKAAAAQQKAAGANSERAVSAEERQYRQRLAAIAAGLDQQARRNPLMRIPDHELPTEAAIARQLGNPARADRFYDEIDRRKALPTHLAEAENRWRNHHTHTTSPHTKTRTTTVAATKQATRDTGKDTGAGR